ncbi:histidine kinase [Actinokineospora sp. NBRC 105648]|uniref:sensor histidine kinase n=1 Tax=Actinokineospora sp. NBRC 105648 TaxID=3032206 RepID=UPI0024A40C89|nr:histidine kinase [Actinokineospora sp. NBRC 105648]GLZ43109.1 two-component sensor histidine kinase [Actinokineospora sp. NBRC 105648]
MGLLAPARRWLAGMVGVAYLFDVLYLRSSETLVPFAPLPLAACLLLAVHRPLPGALAGAGTFLVTSGLLRVADQPPGGGFGVETVLLSETVIGAGLIALVVWRCGGLVAAGAVAAMTVAAGVGVFLRAPDHQWLYGNGREVLLTGLIVLLAGCVAGITLRAHDDRRMPADVRALLRGQWPLAGALVLLIMLDLSGSLYSLDSRAVVFLLPLLLMLGTAYCAVLAPRAPVRYAVTAAALMSAASLALVPIDALFSGNRGFPVSTSIAGAHMALVAFVVRQADRRSAAVGVACLVGADLLAVLSTVRVGTGSADFLLVAAFLLVVSVATGQYFRSRDRERNQSVRVAVTGAQQAERLALARELHDVVAHHVTGIVVQAQAARMVAEGNPAAATEALARIERSGTEALAAMRTLVGSMRGAAVAGAEGQATTDLAADVRSLADNVTGPTVELAVRLPDALAPEVGRSVLRVVQESLTNIGKHAPGAEAVRITIEPAGDELHVWVADDAPAPEVRPPAAAGGYGLVGMRERVELLGGRFQAGPGVVAGWVVDARLPLRRDEP